MLYLRHVPTGQADMGLCCFHMNEDTFPHGATHIPLVRNTMFMLMPFKLYFQLLRLRGTDTLLGEETLIKLSGLPLEKGLIYKERIHSPDFMGRKANRKSQNLSPF